MGLNCIYCFFGIFLGTFWLKTTFLVANFGWQPHFVGSYFMSQPKSSWNFFDCLVSQRHLLKPRLPAPTPPPPIARRCQIFRLGLAFWFRFLNQLLPWFLHRFLFKSQEPYLVPFSVLFKSQEPSSGLFHGLFLKIKYCLTES